MADASTSESGSTNAIYGVFDVRTRRKNTSIEIVRKRPGSGRRNAIHIREKAKQELAGHIPGNVGGGIPKSVGKLFVEG